MAVGDTRDRAMRNKVRALREARGWTQTDLATAVREHLPETDRRVWQQSSISRFENGNGETDVVVAIALALDVPLTELLSDQPVGPDQRLQGEARQIAEAWPRVPEPIREALRPMLLRHAQATGHRQDPESPVDPDRQDPSSADDRRRRARPLVG